MGTNVSSRRHIEELSSDNVNFNHFQILRAIGKGSFGKVCIVQKKDTQKMYAMKYMNKAICIEKDAVKNVLRESMILKRLEFPYLVNLWYTFQDDEDLFMVVDLLMGGDLRYHLQQDVRFSVDCVIIHIAELALTLDYLRSRQIVHRDIKPDNLLFDEMGHVHLTDFNVATVLKENQLSTSVCGTKAYMAPEIFLCGLRECRGYNFSVDWWSLGVVAFELLTRKRPFDIHGNSSLQECKSAILNVEKKPVGRLRSFFNNQQQSSQSSQNAKIDSKCSHITDLIGSLLAINPDERIDNQSQIAKNPAFIDINWREVRHKSIQPKFVPPKGHLNCDPTYELEEMIIESKPLHKKKKRLAKLKANQNAAGDNQVKTADECEREKALLSLEQDFVQYNREKQQIPIEASSSNITLHTADHSKTVKACSDSHLQVHKSRDTKSLSTSLECLH